MPTTSARVDLPATVYPNLSEVAAILGVSPATLSRRSLPCETSGGRDKRVRPSVVLGEAAFHRRRRMQDVAGDLVAYTRRRAPEFTAAVEAEVQEALARWQVPERLSVAELLEDIRLALPEPLFERVAGIFSEAESLPRIAGSHLAPEDLAGLQEWSEDTAAGETGAGLPRRPAANR